MNLKNEKQIDISINNIQWLSDRIVTDLSSSKLLNILDSADRGENRDFLTLAEELEEKDLHYASVLSTRKRAVMSLESIVIGGDKITDEIREIIARPMFRDLCKNLLDGIAKGYSVVEKIYEPNGKKWEIKDFIWRDPRYFKYDKETLSVLKINNNGTEIDLLPEKYIIHTPKLKNGLACRGGLARLASYIFLLKSFALKDWMKFSELFGLPLRIGKFPAGITDEDSIRVLKNAVRNLGSDASAIISDNMNIELVETGNQNSSGQLFTGIITWIDQQISKMVLGQTMTTDQGSSRAQAEVHDVVRQEIVMSDAMDLAETINRDLIESYIRINYGTLANPPKFKFIKKKEKDIATTIKSILDLRLPVAKEIIYDLLDIPQPKKNDEILEFNTQIKHLSQKEKDDTNKLKKEEIVLMESMDPILNKMMEKIKTELSTKEAEELYAQAFRSIYLKGINDIKNEIQ